MNGFRRDRLRERRLQRGWSQRDLAGKSGVGQDTISGIEAGHRDPRPSTLRKLADALDVEVHDFFTEAGVATNAPKEGKVGSPLTAPLSSPDAQDWLREREREGGLLYMPLSDWLDELAEMDVLEVNQEGVRIEEEYDKLRQRIRAHGRELREERINRQNAETVAAELRGLERALRQDLHRRYRRRRFIQMSLAWALFEKERESLSREEVMELSRNAEANLPAS